jgi:hypothetical protein
MSLPFLMPTNAIRVPGISMPLSGGPSLILASCPMSWQGEHNRLNTCLPAAASLRQRGPGRSCKSNSSSHPYPQHFFSSLTRSTSRPARRSSKYDPKSVLVNA